MARNPVWRKTRRQWRDQIERWTRRRDPVAVRFADALLDFRAISGPVAPASELRAQLDNAFQNDNAILRELCRDAPLRTVALGWFGHLVPNNEGRIDLKEHGLLPLVSAVRLWALRHAIPQTGTLARLRGLGQQGVLDSQEAASLSDAYSFVARLILLQQLKNAQVGDSVGYLIDPRELRRDERDHLVEALRWVSSFDGETRAVFAGEIY
jgi:signal-transduction protein with cAMP-binding, CBS, and nucleotidyltransferase domain